MRLIVNRVRLFQSTLPRGERQVLPVPRPPVKIYFNPRSHEGSDKGEFNALMNAYISIHAPTRGATEDEQNEIVTLLFQSTLPRGERLLHGRLWRQRIRFQSTLPRGERPVQTVQTRRAVQISIHAPTRGATLSGLPGLLQK